MTDYLRKFRLDGKCAYVIGGLGLIGKQVSKAFAMAGAETLVLDVNESEGQDFEIKAKNESYPLTFCRYDCSNMDNLEDNFTQILNKFRKPDVYINCSYPRTEDWAKSSFKDISIESFRKNVDIHMNSFSWLARMAAESMVRKKKGGSIIQMGSTYGVVGQDLSVYQHTDMHENMTYAAIKGGIINLTRQMAAYYGQFDIRINTVCPGGLEGPVAGKSSSQSRTFIDQYNNKTPLKRLGRADEIAAVALFLASDAASYVHGATIMVDGGWTAV